MASGAAGSLSELKRRISEMICEIREGGREVVLHHPTLLDVLTMLTLLFRRDKEIVFTKPQEDLP